MSIFGADCPHCGTRGVAFTIVSEKRAAKASDYLWDTLAICGRCSRGILASFRAPGGTTPIGLLNSGNGHQLEERTISPTAPDTGAPNRTPERAANFYRQGMENLPNNLAQLVNRMPRSYGGGEAGPVLGAGARPTRWNQLR